VHYRLEGANAALQSLLTALANLGLMTDSSSKKRRGGRPCDGNRPPPVSEAARVMWPWRAPNTLNPASSPLSSVLSAKSLSLDQAIPLTSVVG